MFKAVVTSGIVFLSTSVGGLAATIGSFDASNTYLDYFLDGSAFGDLRNTFIADGHTLAPSVSTATTANLTDVDLFVTGLLDNAVSGPGVATPSQITALQGFVSGGGTLVVVGDNGGFATNANTWLTAFGLSLDAANVSGGAFAIGANPLLANGVSGSALNYASGSVFNTGSYETLASVDGDAVVVSTSYGAGRVIGMGDVNFISDISSTQTLQFMRNIADTSAIAAVPLPAGLPLLLAALGALAVLRRRFE